MSTLIDRLRAARQIYAEMLAQKTSACDCAILAANIASLDQKIDALTKKERR